MILFAQNEWTDWMTVVKPSKRQNAALDESASSSVPSNSSFCAISLVFACVARFLLHSLVAALCKHGTLLDPPPPVRVRPPGRSPARLFIGRAHRVVRLSVCPRVRPGFITEMPALPHRIRLFLSFFLSAHLLRV